MRPSAESNLFISDRRGSPIALIIWASVDEAVSLGCWQDLIFIYLLVITFVKVARSFSLETCTLIVHVILLEKLYKRLFHVSKLAFLVTFEFLYRITDIFTLQLRRTVSRYLGFSNIVYQIE